MDSTGILVIDPSGLFRAGLRRIMPVEFRIVAEAVDVTTALRNRDALTDNVAIVLLEVAGSRELREEILTLKAALPTARIVHLTATPTAERLQAVFEAGADGCLSKDRSAEALAQAMRLVAIGEKVFPSDLINLLREGQRSSATGTYENGLSGRETQILRALLSGDSNKAIANALRITEATVKVHLKSLMRKLNVNNRTQAAIWAMNHGMAAETEDMARIAR